MRHPNFCKGGVDDPTSRIELDGLLDLTDRTVHVLEAGERVSENQLGLHVGGLPVDEGLNTRACVLELTVDDQDRGRLDLRVVVLREQVGRAHVLPVGSLRIARAHVRVGKLQARLAKLLVLLDGVTQLDDGLLEFFFLEKLLAVLEVGLLLRAGIRARDQHRRRDEAHQPADSLSHH